MKKIIASNFLSILFVMSASAAPIYNLYNAHRAMRVDDILTVVIVESANGGSQSGTNTQKQNDLSVSGANGSGLLKFLPSFGASGSSKVDFSGQGATTRQGSLAAEISARVVKVLDNGNLVIDGSKVLEINEEKEIIKINGVVRPQDIEGNNMIYSYNIADAQITYSGKGTSNTGQRPGFIARFLNWIF
ncbi:MAG: flagellar basal body L-ring protein FlgH [Chitinivibrionales bacterium]